MSTETQTITYNKVAHDADRGRIALSYGNPVICKDWMDRVIEDYDPYIENITEGLTMYEEIPTVPMKKPVADTSILVARLERFMREVE